MVGASPHGQMRQPLFMTIKQPRMSSRLTSSRAHQPLAKSVRLLLYQDRLLSLIQTLMMSPSGSW